MVVVVGTGRLADEKRNEKKNGNDRTANRSEGVRDWEEFIQGRLRK